MLLRLFVVALIFALSGIVNAASLTARFELASETFLRNPHDLKLSPDGKFLYVADVGRNQVTILDPESLKQAGAFGADHQSGTHDVEFDGIARAYVADTHNNRVTIYELFSLPRKMRLK